MTTANLQSAQAQTRINSTRTVIALAEPGEATLVLQRQAATEANTPATDIIYVHGATFGADLSIFYRLDGRSWADAMNDAGLTVWAFDFIGYGRSDRYPPGSNAPAGRATDAVQQLARVVAAVQKSNGGRAVALVAHSWSGIVAARYTAQHPEQIERLALFAPIIQRIPGAPSGAVTPPTLPPVFPLSAWAQYRRFVEDVPRGQTQVLGEAHFQAWSTDYLASDAGAAGRSPPAVLTPSGPIADIGALWSGQTLYDPLALNVPVAIFHGQWDSLCTERDVQALLAVLPGSKKSVLIERGTHLLHLETQRVKLYDAVNSFLTTPLSALKGTP